MDYHLFINYFSLLPTGIHPQIEKLKVHDIWYNKTPTSL